MKRALLAVAVLWGTLASAQRVDGGVDPYAALLVRDAGCSGAATYQVELPPTPAATPASGVSTRSEVLASGSDLLTVRALTPVLARALGSHAERWTLGLRGPSSPTLTWQDRYTFGQGCEAHLCNAHQSAWVLDRVTGALWLFELRLTGRVARVEMLANGEAKADAAGALAAAELINRWLSPYPVRLVGGRLVATECAEHR